MLIALIRFRQRHFVDYDYLHAIADMLMLPRR